MNILLDTCTYIWFRTEPEKLSKKALALLESPDHNFYVSAVSVWEILIKEKIGKLRIKGDLKKLINVSEIADVFDMLSFTAEDAQQIININLKHKDPFDLMLISQAISNDYILLTPDKHIKKYKLKTVW